MFDLVMWDWLGTLWDEQFKHHAKTCVQLLNQRKIHQCIVTNGAYDQQMSELDIALIITPSMGFAPKPRSDMLSYAIDHYASKNPLFIGDSLTDMQAAAGVRCTFWIADSGLVNVYNKLLTGSF